ncbi:Fc.00g086630.m01.CDS01 [Cosmosporella sp. VM-42]
MTASRTDGAEAWTSWLSSFPLCCAPLASCLDKRQGRSRMSDEELLMGQDDEKSIYPVVYDQPLHQPRPVAALETEFPEQDMRGKAPRRSFASGRSLFSSRKRLWSSSSSSLRRPQISAPSDFRHISSASPHIPQDPSTQNPKLRPAKQLRPRSFRPLELSIYMPDNRMSPILPSFEFPTPPERAYTQDRLDEDQPLMHQRSYSSTTSFHLPRKQPLESSPSTTEEELPPTIPRRSPGRARAYTAPQVDMIKERVANAIIEVEKLQKQIDEVIERQSIYANSRPSTPHSMARTMPDLEPMPSIPALPPAAPSFAERLNSDIVRPHTAPIKSPRSGPHRVKTPEEVSAAFKTPPRIRKDDRPPPPPLPLVLRPPLRKKKSFSRVSSWLFPGSEHNRDLSLDSVTNLPRPVKGSEGFYQVSQGEASGRRSADSVDTISTWETDEDRTVPTTHSPGSTPAMKQEEPLMSRTAIFGRNDMRPKRTSVGVAM